MMGSGAFIVVVTGREFVKAVAGGSLDECDGDRSADLSEMDDFFIREIYF